MIHFGSLETPKALPPESIVRLRESLCRALEETPPKDILSLHARWIAVVADAGEDNWELLEELRCQLLRQLSAQGSSRFKILQKIIALDLMMFSAGSSVEPLQEDDPSETTRRLIRCCLNDLTQARDEISGHGSDSFDRMNDVIWLTRSYLHYEFICPEYRRDLELQGLEVRRGLEKLAYETIAEISAPGLKANRLDTGYAGEVAQDLKVIYHHAFDAGKLVTLLLLGSREGLGQIMELSCAAAVLIGEAEMRPAAEGLFRYLESAELYARLGLEARVSRCLDQARKLVPELPAKERSAAYLRIEQVQRQPVRLFLGHGD